jgi:hypothetical protein
MVRVVALRNSYRVRSIKLRTGLEAGLLDNKTYVLGYACTGVGLTMRSTWYKLLEEARHRTYRA